MLYSYQDFFMQPGTYGSLYDEVGQQDCLRSVISLSPSSFSVEHFLSTGKLNGDSHHGMHISSNIQGTRTEVSKYTSKYDIWRSWNDCLWFQELLEVRYERAAREKKMRLRQGKGVKGFNGLYKKDLASSWDSLPSGPNPDSVAHDIHEYLPLLTKRGTLFRPSKTTIDRRQAELVAFIEALFSDDMPTLIKELRVNNDDFSFFFGLWKRDCEITKLLKAATQNSLTNSVSSPNLSTSRPTSPWSDSSSRNSPSKTRFQLFTASRPLSMGLFRNRSRSRPHSTLSKSSAHSESSSDTSLSSLGGPDIVGDIPIVFEHDLLELNPSNRSNSIFEVLTKPRASWRKAKRNHWSSKESLPPAGDRSVRESWQTTDSQDPKVDDLLDGIGLTLPHPIEDQKFRASVASISTYMTTDSADAVIPQTPPTETLCFPMSSSRFSIPMSLVEFVLYPDNDVNDSVLDVFPRPVSMGPESRPDTPVDKLSLPDSPSFTRCAFNRPASPTCFPLSTSSTFSAITSTAFPADSISIKAIYDTSIISLRVSRGIGFADLRQRLYNKFVEQERIPLSQAYSVVFVSPNPALASACSRPGSVTSTNQFDVQWIISESDWEQLVSALQGNKIILCILDP